MRQAQINVRTRACSRTSIARTKQAALTHNVRGKELILFFIIIFFINLSNIVRNLINIIINLNDIVVSIFLIMRLFLVKLLCIATPITPFTPPFFPLSR